MTAAAALPARRRYGDDADAGSAGGDWLIAGSTCPGRAFGTYHSPKSTLRRDGNSHAAARFGPEALQFAGRSAAGCCLPARQYRIPRAARRISHTTSNSRPSGPSRTRLWWCRVGSADEEPARSGAPQAGKAPRACRPPRPGDTCRPGPLRRPTGSCGADLEQSEVVVVGRTRRPQNAAPWKPSGAWQPARTMTPE